MTGPPRLLANLDVLLVEDETLISLLLEDMLADLGAREVRYAARLGTALALFKAKPPDVALLDVNLAGEPVFPLAEKLAARGVPFLFITGYGRAGFNQRWADRDVIQKPFTFEVLTRALAKILGAEKR